VSLNDSHMTYSGCEGSGTGAIEMSWLLSAKGGVFLQLIAGTSEFEAETYPTSLTGSQTATGQHAFGMEAGSIKCTSATFSGSLTGSSHTMTLNPAYSGCTAFNGFATAEIAMNGCSYVYSVGEGENYPQDITCPAGASITIKAGTCTISIPAQTGVRGDDYALLRPSSTGRDAIEIQSHLSGLTYTVTHDGFACPFNGTGTRTSGTYTGNTLLEGRSAAGLPANIKINT
jgi:hypothetical protein